MLQGADSTLPNTHAEPEAPLGRIVSVSGSQAVVLLHPADPSHPETATPAEMGTLIKVETPESIVLGLVSALTVPVPSHEVTDQEMKIIELEFVGELPRSERSTLLPFRRGISTYPALGDQVHHAGNDILAKAYACDGEDSVRLGTIVQEPSIPAMAKTNDLLGKHLAILGSTGTGKSCSVALLLRNILRKTPNAHIVLLDPHREYQPAFEGLAEVITSDNLTLPFWLLTFEEISEILIGNQGGREDDIETLRELIPVAKARYGANQRRVELRTMLSKADQEGASPSVDTPVPYRISDLIALLDEHIGKLDLRGELAPLKRLKSRLETISRDPRYSFMFGSLTVQDTMADVLGRIFRVPVNGKPITIFELAGLPSEIINVVVSVLSRMTFDFAMWSTGRIPITLVCEEAHRYAPANSTLGFEPTKRALAKIAKEGRKYGVSLCIVSQRPAELDSTILSQCASIVCMRLTNEHDQEIARARVSDGSASLLDVLPSLATGEAVVFGEGITLPTRIRFDMLPEDALPRSRSARFSEDWQRDIGDVDLLHHIVERWRAQSLGVHVAGATAPGEQETSASAAQPQPDRRQVAHPAAQPVQPQPAPRKTAPRPVPQHVARPQQPAPAPAVGRQQGEPGPAAAALPAGHQAQPKQPPAQSAPLRPTPASAPAQVTRQPVPTPQAPAAPAPDAPAAAPASTQPTQPATGSVQQPAQTSAAAAADHGNTASTHGTPRPQPAATEPNTAGSRTKGNGRQNPSLGFRPTV